MMLGGELEGKPTRGAAPAGWAKQGEGLFPSCFTGALGRAETPHESNGGVVGGKRFPIDFDAMYPCVILGEFGGRKVSDVERLCMRCRDVF